MKAPSRRSTRRTFLNGMGSLCGTTFFAHVSQQNPLLARSHAGDASPYAFETSFPAMGSLLRLRWFDSVHASQTQARQLASIVDQTAKRVAEHWNSLLSDYDRESEASLVAERADSGDWIEVSEELASVLDACDDWNALSQGAFDASIGAVTRLRRRSKRPNHARLPTQAQWDAAFKQTGWKQLEWDSSRKRLRFLTPGIRFDFGAIGKGWVVDRLFEFLQSQELECCSVDFSGNMRFGAAPPGAPGWPVVIDACRIDQGPQQEIANREDIADRELLRLRLTNRSISTSGNRWQSLPDRSSQSQLETSSHILDPNSLQGLENAQSITILANTAAQADAASTATSVRVAKDLPGWLNALERQDGDYQWLLQFSQTDSLHLVTNI